MKKENKKIKFWACVSYIAIQFILIVLFSIDQSICFTHFLVGGKVSIFFIFAIGLFLMGAIYFICIAVSKNIVKFKKQKEKGKGKEDGKQ